MNEQPSNQSSDTPPVAEESHTPYQEGVLHGPHKPTDDPHEQTKQHAANVGNVAYTIGDVAEQKLTEGLDAQDQATTDAINNRDYEQLGSLAGSAIAEEHAPIYEQEDIVKADDSNIA